MNKNIGIFLLLGVLLGLGYFAWDKTNAYKELQSSYSELKGDSVGFLNNSISEDEKEIAKSLIQGSFDDLWGGMDSLKLLDYHTEDYYILEHGEIWTNKEVYDYMGRSRKNLNRPKRVNKMIYHTIEKYGGAINIAYENFGEFYKGDELQTKLKWLESAYIVQTDKGWRIRSMHSTRVPLQENN